MCDVLVDAAYEKITVKRACRLMRDRFLNDENQKNPPRVAALPRGADYFTRKLTGGVCRGGLSANQTVARATCSPRETGHR